MSNINAVTINNLVFSDDLREAAIAMIGALASGNMSFAEIRAVEKFVETLSRDLHGSKFDLAIVDKSFGTFVAECALRKIFPEGEMITLQNLNLKQDDKVINELDVNARELVFSKNFKDVLFSFIKAQIVENKRPQINQTFDM